MRNPYAIGYVLIALLIDILVGGSLAHAQMVVKGSASDISTVNSSGAVTTGGTFQQVFPSTIGTNKRQSVTIQNNETGTDNCWVYIGPIASATEAKAILLTPGSSYQRYWPYVPSDQISITCSGNGDLFYADSQ